MALVSALIGCGNGPNTRVEKILDDLAAGGERREQGITDANAFLGEREPDADAEDRFVKAAVVSTLAETDRQAGNGPPVCGSWADTDEYRRDRTAAALAIQFADFREVKPAVQRGLRARDPYLLAQAVDAAAFPGNRFPYKRSELRRAALNPVARDVLYAGGIDGDTSFMQPRFRLQRARAEADLATWLTASRHFGCQPTNIKLLKTIQEPHGRFYLFSFSTHGREARYGSEPLIGMSGAWPRRYASQANVTTTDLTGTTFKAVTSATLAEHLAELKQALAGQDPPPNP